MIPLSTLPLFCFTAIVLILTPGPDTLYIMARSIGQGRRAGVISAIGIGCGMLVHLSAAVLGLSAILLASPRLFISVKVIGAIYLLWIGVRIILSKSTTSHLKTLDIATDWSIFRQAALTNILNPKVALFVLAVMPQFVDPKMGHIPLQIIGFGLLFDIMGTTWNTGTAMWAGALGQWLQKNRSAARAQQVFTGIVFMGLDLRMALLTER
jgi:threonine/homoserine/homoserine lactone efflux protein